MASGEGGTVPESLGLIVGGLTLVTIGLLVLWLADPLADGEHPRKRGPA
jgi:hypothetical protein